MSKPTSAGPPPRPGSKPRPASTPVPSPGPLAPSPQIPGDPPPLVSGRWLLSAFTLSLVLALVCGYGALCLLFYQGQWQLLFHPSRKVTATPAAAGLAYTNVRFDVTDTGVSQLDGWWVPAAKQVNVIQSIDYGNFTILYLHDSRGSLSDCVPAIAALHSLGINVFAFDYRGFGRSAGAHPTERMGNDDSVAAWTYLTDSRHIAPGRIVLYGNGTGSTFATRLASLYAPAGLILQDPNPAARDTFSRDPRARILPLFLLEKEHLDASRYLLQVRVPLLLLDRTPSSANASDSAARTQFLFKLARYPKQYYDLRHSSNLVWLGTLRRFLDELPRGATN